MRIASLLAFFGVASLVSLSGPITSRADPLLIVGNDEKITWDAKGNGIMAPPGKDSVLILDLANPEAPKIVANLPLKNSVVGPPVNVAIAPDKSIALVADSVDVVKDGDKLKQEPDDKRALATKFNAHKVSLLDVNGDKVTYAKFDLPTGQWPYNVAVAPGGKIALTADNGGAGSSDGSVDTVSVVDLELDPARIVDRVVVGDGPEGLAISPKGDVAAAIILAGSNNPSAYFYKKNGSVSVLSIAGKKVTKVGDVEVGGLPEGAAFTPDGKYLLVGNYLDQDLSILKVEGTKITDTGKRFKLPGHPASLRMSDH